MYLNETSQNKVFQIPYTLMQNPLSQSIKLLKNFQNVTKNKSIIFNHAPRNF